MKPRENLPTNQPGSINNFICLRGEIIYCRSERSKSYPRGVPTIGRALKVECLRRLLNRFDRKVVIIIIRSQLHRSDGTMILLHYCIENSVVVVVVFRPRLVWRYR